MGLVDMVGQQLGPYAVEAELGSGGMGTVYRASGPEGTVALKVLHSHLTSTPEYYERFEREAELGCAITHPNVVRTLAVDTVELEGKPTHYIAMEFVEGQTLQQLLAELEHFPEELCRHVGIQITRALSAIHAQAAVHRDLKPANVIITPDHSVKVMDFGVARLTDASQQLSVAGQFLGSILYAAPEQWDPEAKVDGRADLFALGILLYEVSTGRHPFAGLEGTAPLAALATCRIEPASATNPELSSFLVELIDGLLKPDPADRFPAAALVHDVIEAGERSQWWQARSRELELSGRGRVRRLEVPRGARVFGRDAELDQLRGALARTLAGEGQVVLVEGETGIGKTRLVDEFVRLEEGAFEFLFGAYPPDGGGAMSGALSTAFREYLGSEGLEERLDELLGETPGLAQPLAAHLRGTADTSSPDRVPAESLSTAFVETAKALARDKPLVLFVDNLDYAPREGRALFAALANAIREVPILLIGAVRPETAGDQIARVQTLPYATRLTLHRLGPNDITSLLADALGTRSLADQLSWEVAHKSDGNPFFIFEILRDLRTRGRLIVDEGGSWRSTGSMRGIDTPHSVRDLIRARLEQVPIEDRDLLEVAACAGARFDPAIVAAAAGEALVPALKRFRCLERDHGIIRPDGREYRFDHHQMQEAIYSDLFEQLREQYHFAIADASEGAWRDPSGSQSVELCRHFLYGQAPERASSHLVAALDELQAGYLFDQAVDLANRALDFGIPTDPAGRFAILRRVGQAAYLTGDWKVQESAAKDMAGIAGLLDDDSMRLDAFLAQGLQQYAVADFAESHRSYEQALELATGLDDRHRMESAERGLGIALGRLSRNEEALAHHRRSLELCEERGDDGAAAAAHSNLAMHLVNAQDFDEAEEHYVRAVELARANGQLRWEANATANHGRIFFKRGDFARAWEQAMRFRDLVRRIGDRRGEATSGVILCALWEIFGAVEEIEHEIAHVGVEIEETRDSWLYAFILNERAWLAQQGGDFAEARELLDEAIGIRRETEDREGLALALTEAGSLATERGDTDRAVALLTEAVSIEEAEPDTRALALCALAVHQPDRVEEAEAALDAILDGGPVLVRGAWCLWRATGDRIHLERAYRDLEDLLSRIPAEYRDSARTRDRVNRAVIASWKSG